MESILGVDVTIQNIDTLSKEYYKSLYYIYISISKIKSLEMI
jgi:hypothetical protein